MKYTAALLALAAATASAQDISVFPPCSLSCILAGVGKTSCATTDFACVCKHMEEIKQDVTPCVEQACGKDVAQNKVLPATEQFCAAFNGGGSSSSSSAAVPSSSTSSAAPPPASSSSSASASATETSGSSSTGSGSSKITPSATASSTSGGSGSTNGTKPSNPPAASSTVATGGAAQAAVGILGSFGMLVLGAVAAL